MLSLVLFVVAVTYLAVGLWPAAIPVLVAAVVLPRAQRTSWFTNYMERYYARRRAKLERHENAVE
jgi:hypothetical protein